MYGVLVGNLYTTFDKDLRSPNSIIVFSKGRVIKFFNTATEAEVYIEELKKDPISYLKKNSEVPLKITSGLYNLRTGLEVGLNEREPLESIFLDYPKELIPYLDELTDYAIKNFNEVIYWPCIKVVKIDDDISRNNRWLLKNNITAG